MLYHSISMLEGMHRRHNDKRADFTACPFIIQKHYELYLINKSDHGWHG